MGFGANAATNYFLVAERPDDVTYNDSFVIPLTNALHIAHARDLIARGAETAGSAIVFADIVPGANNLNRDLRRADAGIWSWHVTHVTGFGDFGVELYDAWPTYVESNVEGWMQNTGGKIGFWRYTVVSELPLKPRIESIKAQGNQLELSLKNLSPPFPLVVQSTTNLSFPSWQELTNISPTTMATNISLPVVNSHVFIRLRTP